MFGLHPVEKAVRDAIEKRKAAAIKSHDERVAKAEEKHRQETEEYDQLVIDTRARMASKHEQERSAIVDDEVKKVLG